MMASRQCCTCVPNNVAHCYTIINSLSGLTPFPNALAGNSGIWFETQFVKRKKKKEKCSDLPC